MNFVYPEAFLAGIIGLIAFLIKKRPSTEKIYHPDLSSLSKIKRSWKVVLRKPILSLITLLSYLTLTLAASRPQIIQIIPEPINARNIMLVLDISQSMATMDFAFNSDIISRMEGVKKVVNKFLSDRATDRIGLVVFGSTGYLQSPLTLDHKIILDSVNALSAGVAGDGTAIGDGLGIAIKRIKEMSGDTKTIVLLTDGVNNSGSINPLKGANVARDLKIRVHTIGIGGGKLKQNSLMGGIFSLQQRKAEFDEKLLKEIATKTGGVYFNAASVEELAKVYSEIDKLEESTSKASVQRKVTELYPKLLGLSLIFYILLIVLTNTIFLKVP